MRPLRIGLTGGIASGKSTVSRIFGELGVPVIDADEVAREVVEPGTAGLAAVVQRFGPQVLDPAGRLNRAALRAQVFSDPAALMQASMVKGWFFVAITTVLLYFLVLRLLRNIQNTHRREVSALEERQKAFDLLTALVGNRHHRR